ncbi:MAG: NADH-quinone oxidoreductase subunit L [Acidobacteria bacterium]|nr:NADH-quinone oxidoreductase subunit L [Acidobacteriota bacterium]
MPAGFSGLDFYYILPELVLTGGALLVLLLSVIVPRRDSVLLGITLATLAATAAALSSFVGVDATASRGLLAIDGFAIFFKVIALLSAALTVLMSAPYLRVEGVRAGEYYFLILCATLGMMFMASGLDLITLFIGLETMAIAFYVLAGFLKSNPRSNEAAVKYFLLGAFSLGILLYGMSLLYGATGTTKLEGIAAALSGQDVGVVLVLAVVLVGAGMGFKIAAVPFHMWAPDVYEGAPTPVTAFLSVGSKAASFAMLLRIFFEGLPALAAEWKMLFWVLAVVTMTVGNIAALTQSNLKRMLAYSSIAHAGYLLIGVVVGTARGVEAMLVYLGVYLFMQLGAFAIVTVMRRSDVIGDELKDLNGLSKRSPIAAFAMLFFMLSLGGIPPTAGFMGKMWLFGAAVDGGAIWLAVLAVANSAVSLYYYLRVVVFMWVNEDEPAGSPITIGPAMAVTLGVALLGTIILGVYPQALFEYAEAAARTLGGVSPSVALQ